MYLKNTHEESTHYKVDELVIGHSNAFHHPISHIVYTVTWLLSTLNITVADISTCKKSNYLGVIFYFYSTLSIILPLLGGDIC